MKTEEKRALERPEDSRTIAQLAQESLDVQDACNLSGVVLSFGRSILRLRRLLEALGPLSTDQVNQHPICQLWADKIAHLSGTQSLDNTWSTAAYHAVYELAAGREVARAS